MDRLCYREKSAFNNGGFSMRAVICAAFLLLVVFLGLGYLNMQRVSSHFAPALACERRGAYREAIERYDAAESAVSDGARFSRYDYLGRCYFLLGEIEKSLASYNSMLELAKISHLNMNPDSPPKGAILSLRVQVLVQEGDYAQALQCCDMMIKACNRISSRRFGATPDVNSTEYYYRGSSEGYVRKYDLLKTMGREQEAEDLLANYKEKHRADLSHDRDSSLQGHP